MFSRRERQQVTSGAIMRFSVRLTAAVFGLVTVAPMALAQIEGVVVGAVSEDAGSVIVMRGSETFSLRSGDTLVEGDIVMTRSNGAVTLVYGETCSRDLEALQSLTISEEFCVRAIASVDQSGVVLGDETVEGGVGAALPVIGALAVAGGAAAAAGGGDGDDTPTSP